MTEFHRLFPAISIEVLCSQAPPEVGSMEADIISTWHPPGHPDLVVLAKNRMIFNLARRPNISNEMGCRAVLRNLKYHQLCDHLHYPRDGGWAAIGPS